MAERREQQLDHFPFEKSPLYCVIPIYVFYIILGFLEPDHRRRLSHTNKCHRHYVLKSKLPIYGKFKPEYFHRYIYDDDAFREQVPALSRVHNLTLDRGVLRDVSALSSVHTLTLRNMFGVTDVSALSSVHTLTLKDMIWV